MSNHFPTKGTAAKLSNGSSCPIAGPTFPNEVATAPIDVKRGCSKSDNITVMIKAPTTKMIRYKSRKTKICVNTRGATIFLSIFTRMIALGCRSLFISRNEFLKITRCRIIFIPPLVEPALAPTNNKVKN